jgi:hypothetical protein
VIQPAVSQAIGAAGEVAAWPAALVARAESVGEIGYRELAPPQCRLLLTVVLLTVIVTNRQCAPRLSLPLVARSFSMVQATRRTDQYTTSGETPSYQRSRLWFDAPFGASPRCDWQWGYVVVRSLPGCPQARIVDQVF